MVSKIPTPPTKTAASEASQPVGLAEARRSQEMLDLIPGLEIIGTSDPLTRPLDSPFPDVVYHAYNTQEDEGPEFGFDAFHHGASQHNDIRGTGLYCGDSTLAKHYQRDRRGQVAVLLPFNARIINEGSAAAAQPVPAEVMSSFLEFMELNRLADSGLFGEEIKLVNDYLRRTKGQRPDPDFLTVQDLHNLWGGNRPSKYDPDKERYLRGVKQEMLVKRFNTAALARAAAQGDLRPKVGALFGDFYDVSGVGNLPVDRKVWQRFLMSAGVDGVQFKMWPSADPSNLYETIVFWRYDRIGLQADWQRRMRTAAEAASIGGKLLALLDVKSQDRQPPAEVAVPANQLSQAKHLPEAEAKTILEAVSAAQSKENVSVAGRDLWRTLTKQRINPFEVVSLLAEVDPVASRLLSSDTGVWEGYRLHEHTQAVLGQFERFFAAHLVNQDAVHRSLGGLVRLTLLLQDIGKPLAVAIHSDRSEQTQYNLLIARSILGKIPLNETARSLVLDLMGHDALGNSVKAGRPRPEDAAIVANITDRWRQLMEPAEIHTLMRMIYTCDASAYTAQARYRDAESGKMQRGKKSLDHLFKHSDRSALMRLAEDQAHVVNELFALATRPRLELKR